MRKEVIIGLIFVILLIAGGVFIFKSGDRSVENNYCDTADDCVPDSCCHATSCVNNLNPPICDNTACTMECAPETLDCGQAYCGCINHKCGVVKK